MIVIQLQGGLGNQMFQFAFATILAKKNRAQLLIDLNFYKIGKIQLDCTPRNFELNVFELCYSEASEAEIKNFTTISFFNKIKKKMGINYPKIYQEYNFNFQEEALLNKSPVYLTGYFQSYKYYNNFEGDIRKMFSFPILKLDLKNKAVLENIKDFNTISVHIRRGDYVENPKTQLSHGNCSLAYYYEAIELLAYKNKEVKLLFFSDDINWAKNNFEQFPYSKLFIDHNKDENSWKDMLLMSYCTHNIIANSSFSWWAAWLNENPSKTVVAPKHWFANIDKKTNDLIPPEWIRL